MSDLGTRLDHIEGRLDVISRGLSELLSLSSEVVEDGEDRRRRPQATPAQRRRMQVDKAKAMRQGKAAKRLGLTREQFVAKFGDIDHAPEEADNDPQHA